MNPQEEKYEAALKAIAAEIKRQMELESFQRENSPSSIEVSRSSSYKRISEIVADALDIPQRVMV
jgi:lambda repressor-like predicted transcriptional regulator